MNPGTPAAGDGGTAPVAEFPVSLADLASFAAAERAKDEEREERERRRQARRQVGPGWVDTPSSQRVVAALAAAQEWGEIVVIHGGVGVGKTMAARRYASNCENAWIAVMRPSANRLRPCLQQVAGACGVWYRAGGSYQTSGSFRLSQAIADRIRDTDGLLIIDEAQNLGHAPLEELRALHDETECGLALVGNDDFGRSISSTPKFSALASRAGMPVSLPRATAGDVEAMLDAWEVEGESNRKRGHLLADPPGGLRRLVRALKREALASGKAAAAGRPSQPGGAA